MFPVNIVFPVPELLTQGNELGALLVTMFPEIVNVPDPEFINVVVDPEPEPLIVPTMLAELVPDKFTKFEEDGVNVAVIVIPFTGRKPPPADAVPPPTNVPAEAAFVMRATFTF
jgi:hypothetical protein